MKQVVKIIFICLMVHTICIHNYVLAKSHKAFCQHNLQRNNKIISQEEIKPDELELLWLYKSLPVLEETKLQWDIGNGYFDKVDIIRKNIDVSQEDIFISLTSKNVDEKDIPIENPCKYKIQALYSYEYNNQIFCYEIVCQILNIDCNYSTARGASMSIYYSDNDNDGICETKYIKPPWPPFPKWIKDDKQKQIDEENFHIPD